MKKPLERGLYYFHNHGHVTHPHLTGSQLTYTWAQIQPYGNGYNWGMIDGWVTQEKARGHKWVWRMDVHQNRGVISWPGWVPHVELTLADGRASFSPDYASPVFQDKLVQVIRDVGAKYDSDPDLTLVQIGLGLYGETHPERDDGQGNLMGQIYQKGLTACEWIAYCKRIMAAYAEAFPTTELVIMNATTYPFPCRDTEPPYTSRYAREELDEYALELGIGAQNNSWDEWDNRWYTAEVAGTNGPYTVTGCVGPFERVGRMLAMERGSWLAPYNTHFQATGHQTWWSYLNGLSKGARILFPPNLPRKVWDEDHYIEFDAGVFGYPEDAPYADALDLMHNWVMGALAGDTYIWAAFSTPTDTPWRQTSQTWDHEIGISCITELPASWNVGVIEPPWYEGKYCRLLHGDAEFSIEPGTYNVTIFFNGAIDAFGEQDETYNGQWGSLSTTATVGDTFNVSGDCCYLHALIFEKIDEPDPPEPPAPPVDPPADEPIVLELPWPVFGYAWTVTGIKQEMK